MPKGEFSIHYLKDFTHKGTKYKFKKPLRVRICNFYALDGKTIHGELEIPEVLGGYTRTEPFNDPDKEIREYVKSEFDTYVLKEDKDLTEDEREYKYSWIDLLKIK